MRFAPVALVASVLAVAFSTTARAHDSDEALEKANQVEKAGREMLEQGHRVEGAKTIAEAWRIRAEVWAREQTSPKDGQAPELEAVRAKIEKLKAASNDAEHAGHELKTAGKTDEAAAKMEESGRLWKEAEALEAKLKEKVQVDREAYLLGDAIDSQAREQHTIELKKQMERAREEADDAEADMKKADAEGRETAAATARERAERLRKRARELEASIASPDKPRVVGPYLRRPEGALRETDWHWATLPRGGLEAEVNTLRNQLREMRQMIEEIRRRLDVK